MLLFDPLHHNNAQGHGRTNDSVHVKGLEVEHFKNAEPGNRLGLVHGDSEDDSDENIS